MDKILPSDRSDDGGVMIEEISIENFRSFEKIELKKCKTLNVVLGRNASGKTALLEAIFLALGSSPELAQRLRQWRDLPQIIPNNFSADKSFWSDLFRDFDTSKTIKIDLKGRGGPERTLRIVYDEEDKIKGIPVPQLATGQNIPQSPIKFEYKRPGKSPQVAQTIYIGGQIGYSGVDSLASEVVFFTAQSNSSAQELADRYSDLGRAGKAPLLIDAVRQEFPFIQELAVFTQFGIPQLHIRKVGLKEAFPVGLASSGISKIIQVLTAIAVYEKGVILLDEIENGIYYDRYEALWRSIYTFAKANNTQIFASSHNEECLRALANVSSDWASDISFIRFGDKEPRVEQFHGKTMFGAMELGEIR